MQSKEEIEKAKRYFEDEIHYEKTTYNCVNHYRQTIIDNHIILYKYIRQLESDKQKLIERLEDDVINITKTMQDGKHYDDYSKCRLKAYRTKTKEILKILK